jgi:hypothetical protein
MRVRSVRPCRPVTSASKRQDPLAGRNLGVLVGSYEMFPSNQYCDRCLRQTVSYIGGFHCPTEWTAIQAPDDGAGTRRAIVGIAGASRVYNH